MASPRARWRVLLGRGLLFVLGLAAVSALVEHVLEVRDTARLTAGDTYYAPAGRRVRYRRTGVDAPGPTIILISGMMASLEQWDQVQTALSTVAPVVSYDRAGMGFSDPADGHDAIAGSDELDQLLHAPGIAGPFVVVCYSSSTPLAEVFVAKHLDVVKGLVFVDPTMRSTDPSAKTFARIYWKPSVTLTLRAFLGITRLKLALADRGAPPLAPVPERIEAVVESSHHWLATARDTMTLDRSADEADAVMATHPFVALPLGVLSTTDPDESEAARADFDLKKELAASSERGIVRSTHGDHTKLLSDPVAVRSVVDLVRTITDEARGKPAGGEVLGSP